MFFRSGWTQEELASKEGKGQTWVNCKLRFGRFLEFLSDNTTGINLTERAFRTFWEQTEGSSELRRFQRVKEMMIAQERAGPARNRNALMDEIREHYSNGKWHGTDAIAAARSQRGRSGMGTAHTRGQVGSASQRTTP